MLECLVAICATLFTEYSVVTLISKFYPYYYAKTDACYYDYRSWLSSGSGSYYVCPLYAYVSHGVLYLGPPTLAQQW